MVHGGWAPTSILRHRCYLVASVHSTLDDTQLAQFRRDLVEAIGDHRARGVVIDVAALDVLDSFGHRTVCDISEMARLRGAATVIVGIQPDVAFAISSLGRSGGSIRTVLDLEEGLDVLDRVTVAGRAAGPATAPTSGGR